MSDGYPVPVEVRRFRSDDGERVRALNEEAMATTPEYDPDLPDEDLREVKATYLDGEGEFLVGVGDDGTIVGMGAYALPSEWLGEFVPIDDQTAELARMRVDPECHGQGIGSAIYRELARRARQDGYEQFVLNTGVENDVARGFYEQLGFQLQQEVSIESGAVTFELALYQKSVQT
ncbi:GNAT family N-acetyltransferase [Halobaculum limi]|uniref:GNAT family N-acetyltransferase n=1 Tax=Halobaculum limi TaxID=3031916 RepID=UPI002406911F|nr:GNAT family N-acetyltransferase [Halobaculum sp. YSMS11]